MYFTIYGYFLSFFQSTVRYLSLTPSMYLLQVLRTQILGVADIFANAELDTKVPYCNQWGKEHLITEVLQLIFCNTNKLAE